MTAMTVMTVNIKYIIFFIYIFFKYTLFKRMIILNRHNRQHANN